MNKIVAYCTMAFVAVLASCQGILPSQTEISEEELKSHLEFLASDSLKGRKPGTTYDRIAAKYVKDELAKYGLKLLGQNGYQFFDLIVKQHPGENTLAINGKELAFGTDFSVLPLSSNSEAESVICFAGYGFHYTADNILWNDYHPINARGKWVLILRGDPEIDNPNSPYSNQSGDKEKALIAADQGAIGVLLVSGTSYDSDDKLYKMEEKAFSVGIPVFHVTRATANTILKNNGLTIEQAEATLNKTKSPISEETNTLVSGKSELTNEIKSTQNVVALIEGTDEQLKNEYIVIGAHYDHLGMGGHESSSRMPDTTAVHNGADDNASGVAALLEVAQKLAKDKPKRSILFVAFSSEELGLIGSQKFVNEGPISTSNMVAMLNMDMVGRLKDSTLQVGGTQTAIEMEVYIDSLVRPYPIKLAKSPEGYGPSDHASFYSMNIPVLFFSTGAHTDYHTPFDDIDKINFKGLSAVSSYVYDIAKALANTPKKLTFNEAGPKSKPARHGRGLKVKLGIMPDVNQGDNNGLRVIAVTPENPASLGGMKNNDIITSINGKPVKNIQDYMFRLSELKAGMTVSVEVKRGDETKVLLIQL